MPKTSRSGVLGFLQHRLEEAEAVGLEAVRITYSTVQTQGREWMMANGWQSYSANNLGRRLREIASGDPSFTLHLSDFGLMMTEVSNHNNEKAWLISRLKEADTSAPSGGRASQEETLKTLLPSQVNPTDPTGTNSPNNPKVTGHDPFALLD